MLGPDLLSRVNYLSDARRQDFAKVLPMQGVGLSSLRGMEQNQIQRTAPPFIELPVHLVIHDGTQPRKLTRLLFVGR